jgi:hypothetical protein
MTNRFSAVAVFVLLIVPASASSADERDDQLQNRYTPLHGQGRCLFFGRI